MRGQMQTDLGNVVIDEEVIATYAGINAVECFGIVGMESLITKTKPALTTRLSK